MGIYIIAELAWSHEGSLEKAVRTMKEAKKAGADAISIHITDMDSYMVPSYGAGRLNKIAAKKVANIYEYLSAINLSFNDWMQFTREARNQKIDICVMPNDILSLQFAEKKIKPDMYVIPAACFEEDVFLKKVALLKKKTIFRIGGAYLGEIERAINIFRNNGNDDIILLHGIQRYPTKLEDTNISFLSSLKSLFNVEVGLADHIDGGDPLAKVIPLLAIPYGTTYIEKHITLDREAKGVDYESALNPSDFSEFVRYVRSAELVIGSAFIRDIKDSELAYRDLVRKKIVASGNIAAGKAITKNDLIFKRCDEGIPPSSADILIGRVAAVNIAKDEAVTLEKTTCKGK